MATLAIINAIVWSGGAVVDADAVVVAKDRIAFVGSTEKALEMCNGDACRVIDGGGQLFVSPGFHDAHLHFLTGGRSLTRVPLAEVTSKAAFVDALQKWIASHSASEHGDWVEGGGWNEVKMGGAWPDKTWLDAVAGDRPVLLYRIDYHSIVVNTAALHIAGITRDTPDPPSGRIDRDENGEPTGILREDAMKLVRDTIPRVLRPAATLAAMEAATAELHQHGITCCHSMVALDYSDVEEIQFLQQMEREGKLKIRVTTAVKLRHRDRFATFLSDAQTHESPLVRFPGLKAFADGSLGSQTAAMIDPYNAGRDELTCSCKQNPNKGLLLIPPDTLRSEAVAADAQGMQLMVHAIGDNAVRTVLETNDHVATANGPKDRRLRIEHAQHVHPDDVPRFGAEGVIPSIQPTHMELDAPVIERLLGLERSRTVFPLRSLIDTGSRPCLGSDWPVCNPSVLRGIQNAVCRPAPFSAAEAITIDEALLGYTKYAAHAAFLEKDVGELKSGMFADITVLDRNPKLVAPTSSLTAAVNVKYTVVAGEVVFESKERGTCHRD